jgi:YD repeat-containing protein
VSRIVTAPEDPLYVEDDVPIRDAVARRAGVETITGSTYPIGAGVPSNDGFKSFLLRYTPEGKRTVHERYDEAGKVIRARSYDDGGKLLEDVAYDRLGNVDYRFDIAYDGRGWTERRMSSPPGRLHYRIVADRDAAGRLVRATFYDPNGETLRSDAYEYDARGRLARVDAGHLGGRAYEYGEDGNLAGKRIDAPGASAFGEAYEFEYDGRGLLTRMSRLHFDDTRFSFEVAP